MPIIHYKTAEVLVCVLDNNVTKTCEDQGQSLFLFNIYNKNGEHAKIWHASEINDNSLKIIILSF